MKGMSTRDALICPQVLPQRCRDMNCYIFACFIDYEKTFDMIEHDDKIEVLKNTGMNDKGSKDPPKSLLELVSNY